MPTTQVPFFSTDPNAQANWLQLQQREALARALLDQGLTPIDTSNRQVGGIAYHVSPLEGVAKVFQSYMGQKMLADTLRQEGALQAQQYAGILGAMGGSQQPPQPQPPDAGTSTPTDDDATAQIGSDPSAIAAVLRAGSDQQVPIPGNWSGQTRQNIGPTPDRAAMLQQTQAAPQQPQQPMPAARMGGQVFVDAATRFGLPTDQGTLNAIVGLVNRGMDPGQAAATVAQQRGQQPGQPQAQGQPMRQPQASTPSGTGGPTPMNPAGISPSLAAYAFMSDPGAYARTVMQQNGPTDFQKIAAAAGLQPGSDAYRAALNSWMRKQTYIPPVPIRPGGGVQDQRTGQITTMPTAAPQGFQNVQRPDGSWATVPIANGPAASMYSTYATEAGKAPFAMVEGFDPRSNAPFKNFAGNVLPMPSLPQLPQAPGSTDNTPPAQPAPQVTTRPPVSGPGSAAGARVQPSRRDQITAAINGTPQAPAPAAPTTTQGAPGNDRRAQLTAAVNNAARPPGVQSGPALGAAQGATNAQDELSKSWAGQQSANQSSQTNISLLQSLKGLAAQAATGYEPARRQYLLQLGAYVGIPNMDANASATDLFNKYSAQLVQGISARGADTDAARALVASASPNQHMQPQAISEAADYLTGRELMTQARTRALQPYAVNRDPAGYQRAQSDFDQVADPRLYQLRGMNPQQAQAFVSRLSPSDAQSLLQKYNAAKQRGYLQ
jgi:hypothetical protein